MAVDIERLVVQLSADVKKYENALNRAMGVTNRQTKAIESRFAKMNKNISSSFANALRGGAAALGGALGVREITQYADAWTEAGNKIRAAATSAGVQARSLSEINKGANDARTSLTEYADLYARLIRSASGVAKSEGEIAAATNAVAKAFKAGGASASEQAAGILQLGQALGSGVLQGDELRSLRENAPIVAQAIAKEFQTTIAGLKQLGADGKLTSDRVFKAILAAIPDIEKQFAATNKTISDGFVKVRNNLTEYIGTMAEASGVTNAVNAILAAMAGNISSVANAAAAAGVVLAATFGRGAAIATIGALANPFVALAAAIGTAAYALTQLWDDVVPLQGSLATLGDYATALWETLETGASTVKETVVGAFDAIVDGINGALEGVGTSISGLWEMVKSGVNTIIDSFSRMAELIQAAFAAVPNAVGSAVVTAMNTMIAGVEAGINKVIQAVNAAIKAINSVSGALGAPQIGEFNEQQLGRIKDSYAGAAKAAGAAWNQALNRETGDYVGAAGAAVNKTFEDVKKSIVDTANEVHRQRIAIQKDADNLPGGAKSSTTGFGGGIAGVGSGGGGGKGKKSRKDDFAREIEQIKERTAAIQAETAAMAGINPLVDDYGFAVEKARSSQELLTAAQKAGLTITPELRAKIDELATGYASASASAEQLAESQDKARQAAEEMRDLGKDVLGGFIHDLVDGKSAADALAGALGKIADKLLDMAMNDLFSGGLGSLFGGGTSSFLPDILSGARVGLFHKGGVVGQGGAITTVHPSVFANAPRYHSGGIAGVKPGELPAILQKGEVVLPKGARTAGAASQQITIAVDVRGARGNTEIETMVQRGVQQGLSTYDRQLPNRVEQIRRDPRGR